MNEPSEVPESESAQAPNGTDPAQLKQWLEAALLAAGQPLTLNQLNALFPESAQPGHGPLREALALLDAELAERAVELTQVAGGYRLQIRSALMPVVSNLWAERPPKYSRALLETLAIIAYRQPITRGEIEQIRGVSMSTNILKTLQEREWIKVVGHRDIPGKPELLGTTKAFLDYFGLKGLDDLPTLAEIRDLDNIEPELALNDPEQTQAATDDRSTQDPSQDQQQPDPEAEPRRSEEEDQPDVESADASPEHEADDGDAATAEANEGDRIEEDRQEPAAPSARTQDEPPGGSS